MLDSDIDPKGSAGASRHDPDPLGLQLVDLLDRRRSVPPLRLREPGPSPEEVQKLFRVAVRVPDRGMLEPWRIILVQGASREKLGARLAAAFLKGNGGQEPATSELAIRKIRAVLTAPLVAIVVSRVDPAARIPEWEQVLSAGAVCMNLITAVCALGYDSTWLTGWAAYDPAALRVLGAQADERIAGIMPIGTASEPPQERTRPSLQKLLTMWTSS